MGEINFLTVLMSTYNGERYLRQQIDSILAQEGMSVKLLVRDDGSKDGTTAILEQYRKEGKLEWYCGGNLNFQYSFLDLLKNAPESRFYAFCDQDDYWLPSKMRSAVERLEGHDEVPAIYFSAAQVTDVDLNTVWTDMKLGYAFTFGESLFRNPAQGATEVFNHKLREAVVKYHPKELVAHDSWVYRVCGALDGKVFFDPEPKILYRQHTGNVIGANRGFFSNFRRRMRRFTEGDGGERRRTVESLLEGYGDVIPSAEKLEFLCNLRDYRKSLGTRIRVLRSPFIQTRAVENRVAIIYAILFNKF